MTLKGTVQPHAPTFLLFELPLLNLKHEVLMFWGKNQLQVDSDFLGRRPLPEPLTGVKSEPILPCPAPSLTPNSRPDSGSALMDYSVN